jgi:predicted TIM-barrel fold metal-dependent hydrolase
MISSPEVIERCAALLNNHPDRFLMGTDEVAPQDQPSYLKIIDKYKPLLEKLTPEAREKIMKGNYERLFDTARIKMRGWEKAHANDPKPIPAPTPITGTEY